MMKINKKLLSWCYKEDFPAWHRAQNYTEYRFENSPHVEQIFEQYFAQEMEDTYWDEEFMDSYVGGE